MIKSKRHVEARLPVEAIFMMASEFNDLEEEVERLRYESHQRKLVKQRNIFERFSFPPTMVPKKRPYEPEEKCKCHYCRTCTLKKGCLCCECDAHTGGKSCNCSCCESERQCEAYQEYMYDRD